MLLSNNATCTQLYKKLSFSEHALYLKFKAYNSSGRHSSAKKAYDLFAQRYREMYDRNLPYGFTDLQNKGIDDTEEA